MTQGKESGATGRQTSVGFEMKLNPLFSLVYPAAMSIPLAGFGFFEGYLRLVVGMKSWLGQFTHKVVRKRGNCQLVMEIITLPIANCRLPIKRSGGKRAFLTDLTLPIANCRLKSGLKRAFLNAICSNNPKRRQAGALQASYSNLARFSKSTKRGFERSGFHIGSTFRNTMRTSLSANPFSKYSIAFSLSPKPL